jgi:hypothetical protein
LGRLLYVAAFELPGSEPILREHLGPIFDAIMGYFQICTSRGAVCKVDPSLVTLGLIGATCAHYYVSPFVTGGAPPSQTIEEAASFYAQFWLQALTPMRRNSPAPA